MSSLSRMDSLERTLDAWDRPGVGWWARRLLLTVPMYGFLMDAMLRQPLADGGPSRLLGLGLIVPAICGLSWGLNRWWFRQAVDRWGFSLRGLAPLLAINVVLSAGVVLLAGWWTEGGVDASSHRSAIITAGHSALFYISGTEVVFALFRLRQRWAALREEAMRARLAPHFIFNALNTIHAQIESDPQGALVSTERLAHLFRQVLTLSERAVVPLCDELSFVEAYLGIEKVRMGARLTVHIDVPEALENVPVPPLALQVLVENAIKHGLSPLEGGGQLRIAARQVGKHLAVSVEDSGSGLSDHSGTGTALDTLRQRLDRPEDLTLERIPEGFRATFLWPMAG